MPDGLERDLRELRSGMLVAYWNGESPGSRYLRSRAHKLVAGPTGVTSCCTGIASSSGA